MYAGIKEYLVHFGLAAEFACWHFFVVVLSMLCYLFFFYLFMMICWSVLSCPRRLGAAPRASRPGGKRRGRGNGARGPPSGALGAHLRWALLSRGHPRPPRPPSSAEAFLQVDQKPLGGYNWCDNHLLQNVLPGRLDRLRAGRLGAPHRVRAARVRAGAGGAGPGLLLGPCWIHSSWLHGKRRPEAAV